MKIAISGKSRRIEQQMKNWVRNAQSTSREASNAVPSEEEIAADDESIAH